MRYLPGLVVSLCLAVSACTGSIASPGDDPGGGGGDDEPGGPAGRPDAGPGVVTGDDLLAGVLSRAAPPFSAVDHGLAPNALWGDIDGPRATNAWWQNVVLGNGAQPVNVLPYLVSVRDRLVVCAPALVADPSFVFSAFVENLSLGAAEANPSHALVSADALSATIEWRAGAGRMTAPLVRGMPYATMRYAGLTPRITTTHAIESIAGDDGALSGRRFTLRLNNGQTWLLYASAPITFTRDGSTLTASSFTGTLRAALAPDAAATEALDAHAAAIPTGGSVTAKVTGDRAELTFAWKREGSGDLLMMALPHHRDLLASPKAADIDATTIKGRMSGVVGDTWTQRLALPTITWDAPRPIAPARVPAIREALRADKALRPRAQDPYFFGKQASAMARLALIADSLDEDATAREIRGAMATELESWLGDGTTRLRYDRTWGGIVANGAQNDKDAAFGQGFYNDHHFHYGYFLYAAAALARGDAAWAADHKDAITTLIRDIANPYGDDPFFTPYRNKDWFDGHSWAAGLFEFGDSRNQESTSEAVNAWYGLALWGEAIGDARLRDLGRVLMATELVSVQRYWQIKSGNDIYPQAYQARKVVGILWATKVDHATFFGGLVELIHTIQMLPFTPITEELLPAAWIEEEYPVVATALDRAEPRIDQSWRGFIYMAHAIIDPVAAQAEVETLTGFDDGNTRTNTLWWVATRPGAR